uniref:Uncharacterized protein n=1 Tax=Salix viminalis TaxID=40686 RepID=A0A6N2LFQ1_SALVM
MMKVRHSRLHAKKWSTFTSVLSMLFMLTVVLLILSGLGIFSLPVSSEGSSPNDLSSLRRIASESDGGGMGKREEQWTEILSWEPRAFLFHNFLSMERDFKFCIMKLDRSTRLTLTISLTSSTQRMVDRGQLLFLCICQMLKKGGRLYFLLPT